MNAWTTLRTIPTILGLMVRAPGWVIDYSLNYRRAKNRFKRQLIEQGVPRKEAEELADLYPFKIRDIVETARNIN